MIQDKGPNDLEAIIDKLQKESEKLLHNWEEEGIRVEKARWGRSVILKGKIKIELGKEVDASKLTIEQVKEMIEAKAPAKKTAAKKTTTKKATAKKK
jgi:DNA topoisomerase-1